MDKPRSFLFRGEEVSVTVTLTRLPCGAWCQPGKKECRADGIVVCEQRDDDHCFEWSEQVPCPDDSPYCSLGQCSAECIDECAEGEQRCAGPSALQRCGQGDSDPCLEWLEEVHCAQEEKCSAGTCRSQCVDECTNGSVQCSGTGIRNCGDLNLDGCLEWGPPRACPEGESCDDGSCIPSDECTDECTANECTGSAYHECGQYDLDPCQDRSPGTSCVPSNLCLEGSCTLEGCIQTSKVCNEPAAPICISSRMLRVFDAEGSCNEGECTYTSRDVECPNCAIIDGQPNCDACRTVVCNEPPTPQVCYRPSGNCSEGSCEYSYADDMSCDDGNDCTQNDTCESGICAGREITCDAVPIPICVDENTLRTFSAGGTCTSGTCSYPHTERLCEGGCENADGAHCTCEGPCEPEVFADMTGRRMGDITTDEAYIYWTIYFDNEVVRRRKSGGDIEIIATEQRSPWGIAVDETHIYWTNFNGYQIMRRRKSGGDIEIIASDQRGPRSVVLDDTHVYWTNTYNDQVVRRRKSGGDIEIIATEQDGARHITLDDTHIYWTNINGDEVMRKRKSGGDIEIIAAGQDRPSTITLDETYIYWANFFSDEVMRKRKSGGDIEIIAAEQDGAWGIAVTETHIYWSNFFGSQVMRKRKFGGDIEIIAAEQDSAKNIVFDDTHLYWRTSSIMRLSRCACEL